MMNSSVLELPAIEFASIIATESEQPALPVPVVEGVKDEVALVDTRITDNDTSSRYKVEDAQLLRELTVNQAKGIRHSNLGFMIGVWTGLMAFAYERHAKLLIETAPERFASIAGVVGAFAVPAAIGGLSRIRYSQRNQKLRFEALENRYNALQNDLQAQNSEAVSSNTAAIESSIDDILDVDNSPEVAISTQTAEVTSVFPPPLAKDIVVFPPPKFYISNLPPPKLGADTEDIILDKTAPLEDKLPQPAQAAEIGDEREKMRTILIDGMVNSLLAKNDTLYKILSDKYARLGFINDAPTNGDFDLQFGETQDTTTDSTQGEPDLKLAFSDQPPLPPLLPVMRKFSPEEIDAFQREHDTTGTYAGA